MRFNLRLVIHSAAYIQLVSVAMARPGRRWTEPGTCLVSPGFTGQVCLLSGRCRKKPVQVTDVYGIHVDDMNVLEPGEGKVRQDLTTETSGTDDKNLALVPQKVLYLFSHEDRVYI